MRAQSERSEPSCRACTLTKTGLSAETPSGQIFVRVRRCVRVEDVVLVTIRCAGCASIFYLCASHYRGHMYCQRYCRGGAARAAKARHQRSRIGRRNHASHNATYRAKQRANGVQLKKVRYIPTKNLADASFLCVRAVAAPCIEQGRECAPRSTEYAAPKTSHPAFGRPPELDVASASPAPLASTPIDVSVAEHSASCIVCGCTGSFIYSATEAPSRMFRRAREARRRARIRHIVIQCE